MKKYAILACVLGSICLQSCMDSEANTKPISTASAPTTTVKSLNSYNNITLDTAYTSTVVFIDNADDSEAVAYGHFFQFNGAEITTLSIAVPYNLLSYDLDTKLHSINVKAFLKALNDGDNKANMFIKSKSLAGHDYDKTDSILGN